MTIAFDVPVTTSLNSLAEPLAPLSVQAADYRSTRRDGAVVVDLRDSLARRRSGALLGAVALDLDEALDRLTPGTPGALRAATADTRWLLVTDDGHDAEWVAWHLQARGVAGARFLVGGHRALRAAGITGEVESKAQEFFA